ncbi:hypothetical protein QLX67_07585, partial [Balneolaceae bacterium ANBcel3]|nr:hypothetical protein [Balneolaceae bacterium ANBcel3]
VTRFSSSIYPMEPLGDFTSYYNADFHLIPFHDPEVEFSRLLVAGTPEKNLIHFGYNIHWIEAGEALNNSMRTLLKELNFPVNDE